MKSKIDLREADDAIGDVEAVERFVIGALTELLGVQVDRRKCEAARLVTGNLPPQLRRAAPSRSNPSQSASLTDAKGVSLPRAQPSFRRAALPVRDGAQPRARRTRRRARRGHSHASSLPRRPRCSCSAAATSSSSGKDRDEIVAEEMLLWGWRGTPQQKEFLDHAQAKALLASARASSDLSVQARASFLENELSLTGLPARASLTPSLSGNRKSWSRRMSASAR